jgi:predicted RNase H-like nuclease (RuvC/YqgF family)
MITSSKKLKEEIVELNTEVDGLKIERDELKAKLENFSDQESKIAELESNIDTLSAELEETQSELKESQENQADFDEKVANKVRAELASIGSTPAPEQMTDEETKAALVAEYESLSVGDPKRAEFRRKHSTIFH